MLLKQNVDAKFNDWIVRPKPNPAAHIRLFCFSYAGGGAVIFRMWPHDLDPDIEVCAVQLPGRESRFRETPFTNLSPLVQTLTQVLEPYLDKPFAFFGHSMGALICFELVAQLRSQSGLLPVQLFVSARRAPQIPDPLPPIHQLPENEFLTELRRRYNGIPEAVLQNPDLLQLMLPMLRADFAALETYVYSAPAPLQCPIAAFGGSHDVTVDRAQLEAWRIQTQSAFTLQMLPGDHFFLRRSQAILLQAISRYVSVEMERQNGSRAR